MNIQISFLLINDVYLVEMWSNQAFLEANVFLRDVFYTFGQCFFEFYIVPLCMFCHIEDIWGISYVQASRYLYHEMRNMSALYIKTRKKSKKRCEKCVSTLSAYFTRLLICFQYMNTDKRKGKSKGRPYKVQKYKKTTSIGQKSKKVGPLRELNPGPLAPEARIIPLDQAAERQGKIGSCRDESPESACTRQRHLIECLKRGIERLEGGVGLRNVRTGAGCTEHAPFARMQRLWHFRRGWQAPPEEKGGQHRPAWRRGHSYRTSWKYGVGVPAHWHRLEGADRRWVHRARTFCAHAAKCLMDVTRRA